MSSRRDADWCDRDGRAPHFYCIVTLRLVHGPHYHIHNLHFSATVPLAFVGSFHEREQLDGLFRGNGNNPGPKEFHNLGHERMITVKRSDWTLPLLPFGRAACTLSRLRGKFQCARRATCR